MTHILALATPEPCISSSSARLAGAGIAPAPLAEDWTIGLAESRGGVADAAIGFLIFVAFFVSMVGVWSSFVLGTSYLGSHVADLPFLGQFFGP